QCGEENWRGKPECDRGQPGKPPDVVSAQPVGQPAAAQSAHKTPGGSGGAIIDTDFNKWCAEYANHKRRDEDQRTIREQEVERATSQCVHITSLAPKRRESVT